MWHWRNREREKNARTIPLSSSSMRCCRSFSNEFLSGCDCAIVPSFYRPFFIIIQWQNENPSFWLDNAAPFFSFAFIFVCGNKWFWFLPLRFFDSHAPLCGIASVHRQRTNKKKKEESEVCIKMHSRFILIYFIHTFLRYSIECHTHTHKDASCECWLDLFFSFGVFAITSQNPFCDIVVLRNMLFSCIVAC